MEKKENTGEKEEVKVPVQVVQIATETQDVFQVDGEIMNLNNYLCWMGNLLIKIKKGVSG